MALNGSFRAPPQSLAGYPILFCFLIVPSSGIGPELPPPLGRCGLGPEWWEVLPLTAASPLPQPSIGRMSHRKVPAHRPVWPWPGPSPLASAAPTSKWMSRHLPCWVCVGSCCCPLSPSWNWKSPTRITFQIWLRADGRGAVRGWWSCCPLTCWALQGGWGLANQQQVLPSCGLPGRCLFRGLLACGG